MSSDDKRHQLALLNKTDSKAKVSKNLFSFSNIGSEI